jgi:hypothetical protein
MIVENNIAPQLKFYINQDNKPVSVIDPRNGLVTLKAIMKDVNYNDSHGIAWHSNSDSIIDLANDSDDFTFEFDPTNLAEGSYIITTVVNEINTAERHEVANVLALVVDNLAPLSTDLDSDNDGIKDNIEGYQDSDNDGISDYLDNDSNTNYLASAENSQPINTVLGAHLSIGDFVKRVQKGNSQYGSLTMDELASAVEDNAANIHDYHFVAQTPIYDFKVNDIAENGSSIAIVIPMPNTYSLPANALYRKYNTTQGWFTFIENNKNMISSALIDENGNCPDANSTIYRSGLNEGDNCIQLIIADGGVNDADFSANGVVVDPGVISIKKQNQTPVINTDLTVNVNEESEVTLDASNTTDAEQDELTFTWLQTGGIDVDVSDTTSSTLIFNTPSVESTSTLTFKLTVSDGTDSSVAVINVTINQVNKAPSISIDNYSSSYNEGAAVTLTANATDADKNDLLTYSWVQLSGPAITISDTTSAQIALTLPQVSNDQSSKFKVTVSDGLLSASTTATFIISNINQPKEVKPTSTGSGGAMSWLIVLLLIVRFKKPQKFQIAA